MVVFGGPLFEIVLVLFFVFLTMSAIVSTVQELTIQVLQWRSHNLRNGVRGMLGGDAYYKNDIASRFFRSPLIASLGGSKSRVTHIDPDTFVTALATAVQPKWSTQDPVLALPSSVAALQDGELKQRLSLVLPPPSPDADPDTYRALISDSVKAWFESSGRKMSERYKADATALSYMLAAILTVLFNVSPIEIVSRLNSDDTLRTAFAAVVPELSSTLFNTGEGIPVSLPVAATDVAGVDAPGQTLSAASVQTMLALYQCTSKQVSLPIGWPWMADIAERFRSSNVSNFVRLPTEQEACASVAQQAADAPEQQARLAGLTGAQMAVSAIQPEQKFGPSFATDNPALILLGWTIMIFAAAQGAPFWFELLRKMIQR